MPARCSVNTGWSITEWMNEWMNDSLTRLEPPSWPPEPWLSPDCVLSPPWNLPTESPGPSDLTSLCLSCPICKVQFIMGAPSQGGREQCLAEGQRSVSVGCERGIHLILIIPDIIRCIWVHFGGSRGGFILPGACSSPDTNRHLPALHGHTTTSTQPPLLFLPSRASTFGNSISFGVREPWNSCLCPLQVVDPMVAPLSAAGASPLVSDGVIWGWGRAQGLGACRSVVSPFLQAGPPILPHARQPPLTSLVFLVVHLIQDIFPAVSHSPDLSFLLDPLLCGPPPDHPIRYLVSPWLHFSLPVPRFLALSPNQDYRTFRGRSPDHSGPEPAGAQSQCSWPPWEGSRLGNYRTLLHFSESGAPRP